MDNDLNTSLWEFYTLSAFHKTISQAVGPGVDADKASISGPLEDHPAPVQSAILAWIQDHGGSGEDVPILLAIEQYIVTVGDEIQRKFYQGKTDIVVDDAATYREFLEKLVSLFEESESLADYLEVELYSQLPEILKRAKRVRPVVISRVVPDGLRRRYQEATRSYILRNPISCCALCRAILELGLKAEWERCLPGKINPDRFTLTELWQKLPGLPPELPGFCRTVKENGDKTVHGDGRLTPDQAYESLLATQKILHVLYADQ